MEWGGGSVRLMDQGCPCRPEQRPQGGQSGLRVAQVALHKHPNKAKPSVSACAHTGTVWRGSLLWQGDGRGGDSHSLLHRVERKDAVGGGGEEGRDGEGDRGENFTFFVCTFLYFSFV